MKILLLLPIILLIGCASKTIEVNTHYVFACSIYDNAGKLIRDYGGQECLFEKNGNYLIAENDGRLSYRDAFNAIIWTLPDVNAHHGLSVNRANEFLVMASRYDETVKPPVRYDVFFIISREGKILKSYDMFTNYHRYSNNQRNNPKLIWPITWLTYRDGEKFEATHANSFYQINNLSTPSKFFKNGDYLLNVQGRIRRILILSESDFLLKGMLAPRPLLVHDVQTLPDGSLVYFNNTPGSEEMSRSEILKIREDAKGTSSIDIWDIEKDSIRSYFSNTKSSFFMSTAGSFQLFEDGSVLTLDFTNNKSTILHLNKKGDVIKSIKMINSGKIGLNYVRSENLDDFLFLNIGL